MLEDKDIERVESIILDTPEQIEMFHLLQLKYCLKIEINTGLRHSKGSVLKATNALLIRREQISSPFHTKKGALKGLEEYIELRTKELFPDAKTKTQP